MLTVRDRERCGDSGLEGPLVMTVPTVLGAACLVRLGIPAAPPAGKPGASITRAAEPNHGSARDRGVTLYADMSWDVIEDDRSA
jgi:hypothetical protein